MYKYQPVLELLRYKSVSDFEKAFGQDYGTDKGISYDTFIVLLKYKLNMNAKDRDIKHLLCQVDRYSKGSITSTELIDYLGEYDKKRMLPHEGPYETSPVMYPGVRCQDSIVQWILYPEVPGIRDEISGHYVYLSRNRIITVCSKDMQKRFETTIDTVDDGGTGKSSTWATDLACLAREKLLAVATTSGDIRFFRSSIYKFEHRFTIVCLPYILLQMHCYASEKLVCGDFSGCVYIIHLHKDFSARNRQRASHMGPEKLVFEHVKTGKVAGVTYEGMQKMHFSPVQKVEYIPSLKAVISCSLSTKRAMMIHYLERNESLPFMSPSGISCFAFCHRLNSVITGGPDHVLKIWNPNVNTAFIESLTGHTSPINHVLVYEDRLLLASTDREKTVRVWDLLKPRCLQVIKFSESDFRGKQSFASAFLDPFTGSLILSTYRIGKLDLYYATLREKAHPSSEYIVLASYSSVYNCLVTVGNASTVAVWDAESGSLIYEYEKSHEIMDSDGVYHNVSIMTAGLDPTQRRLITADRIGKVKVWNFHLGLCLRSFETGFNILSMCFVGFHIYVGGSSGVIVDVYDNGSDHVEPVVWERHHPRSIVTLDYHREKLVASASCDGELFIWMRRSTEAKVRLKDLKEEDEKAIEVDTNYLAKTEIDRRRKCSISQVMFLQKREMDFFVGNLVSCGMDGRIRFWNIVFTEKVNDGKLLSKFRAVFRESDGILCLDTDVQNRYLICGDTMGYIRVYNLVDYYAEYGSTIPEKNVPTARQLAKFPFLRLQKLIDKKHPEQSKFSEDVEFGSAPLLLNCFRAHLVAVLKVGYVSENDTLVTAGRECSVRLWNLSGVYVGRLGPSGEPWRFVMKKTEKDHMPPDVKSVASSLTLFVMNEGKMPLWAKAFVALKKCRLGHQPEGFEEKPLGWKDQKSASVEELSTQGGTLEEEISKRLPYLPFTRPCKQKVSKD